MKLFIVMKKITTETATIHAIWATETQAKIVAERCNLANELESFYVDDAYVLNNEFITN